MTNMPTGTHTNETLRTRVRGIIAHRRFPGECLGDTHEPHDEPFEDSELENLVDVWVRMLLKGETSYDSIKAAENYLVKQRMAEVERREDLEFSRKGTLDENHGNGTLEDVNGEKGGSLK